MKFVRALFVGILLFVLLVTLVYAGTTTTFQTNVLQQVVQISVPDLVTLDDATPGYVTSEDSFLINNTGTVDVTVTPSLVNSSDSIYKYLYFRESSGSSKQIGSFSMNISKPTNFPGVNSKTFYYKLDLRNFNGTLSQSLLNYKSDVKFIAVAQ